MPRGGKRTGAGRPLGSKDLRPHNSILEAEQAHAGLIPVKFEGDSLEFLRDTFRGKIWPSREQIYAAKSVLPIEHPPAVTFGGRSIEEVKAEAIQEYKEAREREAEITEKSITNGLTPSCWLARMKLLVGCSAENRNGALRRSSSVRSSAC